MLTYDFKNLQPPTSNIVNMVLSAEQIRAWDEFTITNEPVSAHDLMERAANACVQWLDDHGYLPGNFAIFCGKGNNGGDGLAMARMLTNKGCRVSVHKSTDIPQLSPGEIIIDALFGSGLNRPLEGAMVALAEHLNNSGNEIISIDLPSGLFVDESSKGNMVVKANHTLSFQCYKPALLMPENEIFFGEVHILDIGLHPAFQINPLYKFIDVEFVRSIYKPRKQFSHKGTFGHALLVAGSYGKMGAAVMAARACLRSGVGLLTMHVPGCGLQVLQTAVPEAMCEVDRSERSNTHLNTDANSFDAVGVGPGLGKEEATAQMLETILRQCQKPVVLDADALNIISTRQHLLEFVPPYSILTPHPKEFERLFGKCLNDFERIAMAIRQSNKHKIIIVLKGRYTFIACPSGDHYFNSSGNPGMATGGTGDVLTGILTGLLSQKYPPEQAAVFGVFWHGLAGDVASEIYSEESMTASDIPDVLGYALLRISSPHR